MKNAHSGTGEIFVLCGGDIAKRSHQELFALPDAAYHIVEGFITDEVAGVSHVSPKELHIVAGWETLLHAAFWSQGEPSVGDLLSLFAEWGMVDKDRSLLASLTLGDIFLYLCRGEKLYFLRRICRRSKANAEARLHGEIKVHCHIVSEEAGKIVASSL